MKTKKLALVLIAVFVLLLAASSSYAKGPWRGTVIDAGTRQPIEGAAVVAVWMRTIKTPAGPMTDYADSYETVTNKDGEFEVPPKDLSRLKKIREVKGPFFTIFKPGYGPFPRYHVNVKFSNRATADYFTGQTAVVALPKLKTKKEIDESYADTYADIDAYEVPGNKTPELFRLLDSERTYLVSNDTEETAGQ